MSLMSQYGHSQKQPSVDLSGPHVGNSLWARTVLDHQRIGEFSGLQAPKCPGAPVQSLSRLW